MIRDIVKKEQGIAIENGTQVHHIQPVHALCNSMDGSCYLMFDGRPLFADPYHLSVDGAHHLVPLVRSLLEHSD